MASIITRQQIDEMEQRYRASFINSLGGFKSTLLVGTRSAAGQENLAIFSSFFHLGANPPLFGLVVRPDVSRRHTLENIIETGFFTLNQITPDFVEAAHHTSARYPEDISEFEASGLHPEYLENFQAPSVMESIIKWGCAFKERHDMAINGTSIIVGEILWVSVPNELIGQDGFVDLEAAQTVTCSGLDRYHTTKHITRLPYAKPISR